MSNVVLAACTMKAAAAAVPSAVVDAVTRLEAMADKVAGFAVLQNLTWLLASMKGDLNDLVKAHRRAFIVGPLMFVLVYSAPLIGLRHAEADIMPGGSGETPFWRVTAWLFYIREAGVAGACVLAAFAFWGISRPKPEAPRDGASSAPH